MNGKDPAFPILLPEHWPPTRDGTLGYAGLSKRELLAAFALTGLLARGFGGSSMSFYEVADSAYHFADAMIAEAEVDL